MIKYTVIDEFDGFEMLIDIDHAAGQVFARLCPDAYHDDDDGWQSTPFQTASGEHDPKKIAQLVADHFNDSDEQNTITDVIEAGK